MASATVVLVVGVLAVEQLTVTRELRVWRPERVGRGEPVPLRAMLLVDLDQDLGGSQTTGITARWGRGEIALAESALGTVAGELPASDGIAAEVVGGGTRVAFEVSRLEGGASRHRTGDMLQALRLVRGPGVEDIAPELDVRVEGGVCVPEEHCRVWVRRGSPAVMPRLEECTSMERTVLEARGPFVIFDVVVHGPEARCRMLLSETAGADLQLPVALATPYLELQVEDRELVIRGQPALGRDAAFVDVFRDGRWVAARTLIRGDELRVPATSPGLYVVQAREDVASSEWAYQRAAAVGFMVEPWELMRVEAEVFDVPSALSSLEGDRNRLAETRTRLRVIATSASLAAVALMLLVVARRGAASEREARELLVAAGVDGADSPKARVRSAWTVVAFVLAIAFAILLGAGFLIARPYLLG